MWRVRTRDRLLFGGDWDIRNAMPGAVRARRVPDHVAPRSRSGRSAELPDGARGAEAHARRRARRDPHVDGAARRRSVPEHPAVAAPVALRLRAHAAARGADPRSRRYRPGRRRGCARVDGLPVLASSCSRSSTCPASERHELYGYMASSETVGSRCGPVQYRYHSMVDLSPYPDARVRSRLQRADDRAHHRGRGREDAGRGPARARARRLVLSRHAEPARHRAAARPRRALESRSQARVHRTSTCRRCCATRASTSSARTGSAWPTSRWRPATFDTAEVAAKHGVYAEIDDCYFLAYMCRTPLTRRFRLDAASRRADRRARRPPARRSRSDR